MELCAMHDTSENLSVDKLALLYIEMMEFQDLKPLITEEVASFIAANDMVDDRFKVFIPKTRTFYENDQNVHAVCSQTDKMALLLIHDYGCKYKRPKWTNFSSYFQRLESYDYDHFKPTCLFAATLNCIQHQDTAIRKELMTRLKQEMKDSINKCLIGYIVRLMNVFRGYIVKYQVDMDCYEQERARAYLLLNKYVNPYSDDILYQIETLINNKVVCIHEDHTIQILNAYTGECWINVDGLIKVKNNIS